MKILITGANGLVATYLLRELMGLGHQLVCTGLGLSRLGGLQNTVSYRSLDIREGESVFELIEKERPQWIIHNAAWAQPDQCERDPAGCWEVNVTATRFLLEAARSVGAKFLFLSTDFVFSGNNGPYQESDSVGPVNYYGCSKMVAERAVMASGLQWVIVRTVLVYGHSPSVERFNLLTWVRDKLTAGEKIKVVSDQYRTPTYGGDLARGIAMAIQQDAQGLFHISGDEFMTPYEMAMATARALNLDETLIEKVNASVFTQPARRPPRTGFLIDKASKQLGYSPVAFKEGLLKMLNEDLA